MAHHFEIIKSHYNYNPLSDSHDKYYLIRIKNDSAWAGSFKFKNTHYYDVKPKDLVLLSSAVPKCRI